MKCPFELPIKKVVTHVNEAGCKYQVQIVEGKRALAAYLTKDEANYIVATINSHEKLVNALEKIRDTEVRDVEDCDPYGALGICKDTARDALEAEKLCPNA